MNHSQDLTKRMGKLAGQYHLLAVYAFGSRSKEILARVDGEAMEAEYPDSDYVLARAGDLAGWELERRKMILSGEAF